MKLSVLALSLAIASAAHAGTVTFSSLPGPNGDPFTTITEDGVTVTSISGAWSQGFNVGNPVPSIFTSDATSSVEVTMAAPFFFVSFDLGTGGGSGPSWVLDGYLNNVLVLNSSGSNPDAAFNTIVNTSGAQLVDRIVITTNLGATSSANLDNITTLAADVPEPGSFGLLSAGLGVLVFVLRRRSARVE